MTPVSRIRVANTARTVEAEVRPCSFADVVVWQRRIHDPYIAPRGGIGSGWNWPALFIGCHIVERSFGRQAAGFQLRVADQAGNAVPVAQTLFSLGYEWPASARFRCVFVWFLAATPVAALQANGIQDRFSVLNPLLDLAVQISLSRGLEGRVGLRATTGGNSQESEALVAKYRNCGLQQRSKRAVFFRFPVRPDDGRLFYFGPAAALDFARAQDDLR